MKMCTIKNGQRVLSLKKMPTLLWNVFNTVPDPTPEISVATTAESFSVLCIAEDKAETEDEDLTQALESKGDEGAKEDDDYSHTTEITEDKDADGNEDVDREDDYESEEDNYPQSQNWALAFEN